MRVDYRKAFPAGFRAMAALERAVHDSTLEPGLLERCQYPAGSWWSRPPRMGPAQALRYLVLLRGPLDR